MKSFVEYGCGLLTLCGDICREEAISKCMFMYLVLENTLFKTR
jgi:hypothetical protein